MSNEEPVELYESKIADYLFNELVLEGYAPTEEETSVIVGILFDYLVEIGVVGEVIEIEGEDE